MDRFLLHWGQNMTQSLNSSRWNQRSCQAACFGSNSAGFCVIEKPAYGRGRTDSERTNTGNMGHCIIQPREEQAEDPKREGLVFPIRLLLSCNFHSWHCYCLLNSLHTNFTEALWILSVAPHMHISPSGFEPTEFVFRHVKCTNADSRDVRSF